MSWAEVQNILYMDAACIVDSPRNVQMANNGTIVILFFNVWFMWLTRGTVNMCVFINRTIYILCTIFDIDVGYIIYTSPIHRLELIKLFYFLYLNILKMYLLLRF